MNLISGNLSIKNHALTISTLFYVNSRYNVYANHICNLFGRRLINCVTKNKTYPYISIFIWPWHSIADLQIYGNIFWAKCFGTPEKQKLVIYIFLITNGAYSLSVSQQHIHQCQEKGNSFSKRMESLLSMLLVEYSNRGIWCNSTGFERSR